MSRTSRILLVVAALAVAAYVLLERPSRRADDRAQEERSRFSTFDPSGVDAITVYRPGDTLSFAWRDSHWDMVSPVADLAELAKVSSLLHAVESATIARRLGESEDDRRYALDAPAARIVMTAGVDTVFHLDLGGYTIDRSWVYARAAGPDVLLVTTDVRRAATLPADEYRNRRVAVFDLAVVRSFRLETAAGAVRWTRRGARAWFTVSGGDTVPGDSLAVESVLRRLRGMRVREFVAAADTALAFRSPDGVITLDKSGGAPPVTLRFVRRPDGAHWARQDGEARVVAVEGDVEGLLAQSATTLRDRRLLQFEPAKASRIEFVTPDTAGVLVRAGAHWAHPNPALGSIDPARAADLVRALRALQWSDTAPPGERVPSGPPAFSLVVYGSSGTILDGMRAWPRPRDPGTWLASSRSSEDGRLVDAARLTRIADLFRRLRPAPTGR